MSKKQKEADVSDIPVELTPKWWIHKTLPVDDAFIVIPDTMYPQKERGIVYESNDNSEGTDYKTGVVMKSPFGIYDGYWCHYKPQGPHEFHPFRPRHTNGKPGTVESKSALFIRRDDIVLITDKKIF